MLLLAALLGSGLVLFEPIAMRLPDAVLLEWRHANAIAHGLLAGWSLLLLGAVLARHVVPMWQTNRVRWSGVALAAVWAVLALSGQFAQYGSDGRTRDFIVAAHGWLGCALLVPVALHLLRRRHQPEIVP
ncbi:hypothetical protein GCM10025771_40700 [Niveibacterium umoris]|uniref:hypothetical protein n=1 Tax=Niveibacterium umoris TaxID=1193620 RepID=UPI001A8E7CB0|nr:hypothetical protein [Niveibacterium umoris]